MNLEQFDKVRGLTAAEHALLLRLVNLWSRTSIRNKLRTRYYEFKNTLDNIGIAIPPELEHIEVCVSWPAKAVDALQARSKFNGFAFDGSQDRDLVEILRDNNFASMYRQLTTSELIHSCSFVTVSRGTGNEPEAVINAFSAESAVAIWDSRRKRIGCGLTFVSFEDSDTGQVPSEVHMHTSDAIITLQKFGSYWHADRKRHAMGWPMMEAFVFRPSLKRPFGKSRISRPVMSITDSTVRGLLRYELSAELFSAPQRYLLGADESNITKTKWETYLDSMLVANRDADGETPIYGQLPQVSMQPHTGYIKDQAGLFSSATSIPLSSLGIVHDNPPSAEAIHANTEDLVIEAEALNDSNGGSLRNLALMILAIKENTTIDRLTPEQKSVMPVFKNPMRASLGSRADATLKMVQAVPGMSESNVILEHLGFDESEIARINEDRTIAEGRAELDRLLENPSTAVMPTEGTSTLITVIKAVREDAMSEGQAAGIISVSLGMTRGEALALVRGNES